jgi:hypothetical protein
MWDRSRVWVCVCRRQSVEDEAGVVAHGTRDIRLGKTTRNMWQDIGCRGRDSNQVPPEYKSQALDFKPLILVSFLLNS